MLMSTDDSEKPCDTSDITYSTGSLPRGHFARLNRYGKVEIVNELTGEVVAAERTLSQIVEEDALKPYDPLIADLVVNKVIEGTPLTKIYRTPGLPDYATIARWRRHSEEFDKAVRYALRDRAHVYHDLAIEAAESTSSKEEATINRVKIDAYKWSAERTNRDDFGQRPASDDGHAVTNIIISTGVPQPDSVESDAIDITPKTTPESMHHGEGGELVEPGSDTRDD